MGNFTNFRDFQGLIGKKIFREFPIQIEGNSRFGGQKWDFSVFVLYTLSYEGQLAVANHFCQQILSHSNAMNTYLTSFKFAAQSGLELRHGKLIFHS